MTKKSNFVTWFLFFTLSGVSSAWIGSYLGERSATLDLLCNGETAYDSEDWEPPKFAYVQFNLLLSSTEDSNLRMVIEKPDMDPESATRAMQRHSLFSSEISGGRVLVHVKSAAKGETDTLSEKDLPNLGLFIFQPGAELSYRIRRLGESRYLIDDGAPVFVLCSKTRSSPRHDL